MKYEKRVAAGAILSVAVALGLGMTMTANATPLSVAGVCPNVLNEPAHGGGGTGTATDCNLLITFGSDGSIATEVGPQTDYEGIEDALIGVVNNTGKTLTSFNISGSNIFGFDGDGIDPYAHVGPVGSNPDTTGYGGPLGYFTLFDNNNGVVNFADGIASGATAYFSLEEPISTSSLPEISAPKSNVPAPSTLALLGLGAAGLGVARRRKGT